MAKLTSKQQRFVDEYLIDCNATRAACRAGYSTRTSNKIGSQLLGKTSIRAAIDRAQAERTERTRLQASMVLDELGAVALADVRNLVDDDGRLIPLQRLDAGTRRAIASITVKRVTEGNQPAEIITYRFLDKLQALDKAMKHLGLYQEKPPIEVFIASLPEDLAKALSAEISRQVTSLQNPPR